MSDRLRGLFAWGGGGSQGDQNPTQHRGVVIAACILISSFLWFSFSMQEEYPLMIDLPTAVSPLPDGVALTSLPPSTVRVQVQGEGLQLLQLYYNPPLLTLDPRAEAINLEEVTRELLPANVNILSVQPPTLFLQKEQELTRSIPIVSRVSVHTPQTHALLDPPRLDPDSITVTGAQSIVRNLSAWYTERRTFNNVRDSLAASVALVDTLEGLVERDVAFTTVHALSAQFTEGRRELEVIVQGAPTDEKVVTLVPPVISVRFNVRLDQLEEAMRTTFFSASVSYDEIRSDTTGRVRPMLHLPPGVSLREVYFEPSTLRYYNLLLND